MRITDLRTEPDADGYHDTGVAAGQVPADRLLPVQVAGRWLVLVRLEGQVHAFSRQCPHAGSDLSQGDWHRGRVSCPDHGYKFDVKTGRLLWPEDEVYRLKKYPVREVDGTVYVKSGQ